MNEIMNCSGEVTSKAVPIWCKQNLTVTEAAAYSGIGEARIRKLVDQQGERIALRAGKKVLIKRKAFDDFIETTEYI